jgi:D-arabinose 1-dehydrogenase-like Zn-dependent alcohol dehydrogenase
MLVPDDMNGQTVGVLGLGGSGVAAVAALQAAGAHVVALMMAKTSKIFPQFK